MSRSRLLPGLIAGSLLAGVAPALVAIAGPAVADPAADGLRIDSVSNSHPELVSGGQVLLRVTAGVADDPASVHVQRNGVDVTGVFVAQPDGSMLGLVEGLVDGANTVTAGATGPNGEVDAALSLVNHPSGGPVFAGPQQTPFVCQTQDSGLAAPSGPSCDAPPVVSYRYKSVKGQYRTITDPGRVRKDQAYTTVNGRTVPVIVRQEVGVVDRSVYQFTVLWDGSDPSPTRQNTSWNNRLVMTYGGGCNSGYQQGAVQSSGTGDSNDAFLMQGWAVATTSLNRAGNNCSPVLAAEATMTAKERFIEVNGPVVHTVGWGGSGSTILEQGIADAYPGLLDGIMPTLSFTNGAGNLLTIAGDCRLINRFLGTGAAPDGSLRGFTPAQQASLAGFLNFHACTDLDNQQASRLQAVASCPAIVPSRYLWNAQTNPNGIKCSVAAQNVTQLGVDPDTGFPNGYVDNVGVQYGLAAVLSHTITPSQFVTLNRLIGGFDYRGEPQSQRSVANLAGLQAMYADDLTMTGTLGLRTTPIIDLRVYADPEGSGHTSEWSFVTRQRLLNAGGADNQAIVMLDDRGADVSGWALSMMNTWLDAIDADTSDRTQVEKVAAARPTGFGDGCFLGDPPQFTRENLVYGTDTGPCSQQYPVKANPRLVAGQPLDLDVLKCQLKPLVRSDYPGVAFKAAEWGSLKLIFPDGVCDYSKTGVGEVAPRGTWLDYSDAPAPGWSAAP